LTIYVNRKCNSGADKGRAQLRDKFFNGIAFIAEPLAAKIAVEALGVPHPVGQFVRKGGVVGFRFAESHKGRHLHAVFCHAVESLIASLPDVGSDECKESLDPCDTGDRIKGRPLHGVEMRGQPVHLLGVDKGNLPVHVLAGRLVLKRRDRKAGNAPAASAE